MGSNGKGTPLQIVPTLHPDSGQPHLPPLSYTRSQDALTDAPCPKGCVVFPLLSPDVPNVCHLIFSTTRALDTLRIPSFKRRNQRLECVKPTGCARSPILSKGGARKEWRSNGERSWEREVEDGRHRSPIDDAMLPRPIYPLSSACKKPEIQS